MADYCNATTDLQNEFVDIERYAGEEIIDDWAAVSGYANTYKSIFTGTIQGVYQSGTKLTLQTSIALTNTNAGSYYYDSTNDILYIHTTGSDSPDGYVIVNGEPFGTVASWSIKKAMEMVDAYLNKIYSTPLIPRSSSQHGDTAVYEYPIIKATASIACSYIVQRSSPSDTLVNILLKRAYNSNPEPGEEKGIINQLVDGDLILQDQISPREVGHWNVLPSTGNSVDAIPILSGVYNGANYSIWRLQIDAAGVPGTGTYKQSYDRGTEYDEGGHQLRDSGSNSERIYLGYGLYAYFPVVSYTVGDYWEIELFPLSDTSTGGKVYTIRLTK
jgi:hypothetical protein